MSSGWGCQFMGTKGDDKEWCLKLKHHCDPGCKGCIIVGKVEFSQPNISQEQERKVKNRSNNPLGDR
ncbi:hypothetical protein MNB_SV-5-1206 [hydrothermal vent metagenome]|uniref:Uncharacterized protein n=1 Tax=hydrothermal vent metagenome TaxID=652676 RepID=A0A1W1EDH7_9ZZZZ